MARRPCIEGCGRTTTATRCAPCQSTRDHHRNASRIHYQGDYKARAKACRDAANADPGTLCGRPECGQPARPGDPWQAGHVEDGNPESPLRPEHASCNQAAGAHLANARRNTQ